MEKLMLIAVCIILGLYFIFRKKDANSKEMKYDLVIRFNENSYSDIRKMNEFKEIASWTKYGKFGFRGFSKLNKEDLEKYITSTLNMSSGDFTVTKANIGLYLPS